MRKKEIRFIGLNFFELFCVPLYADYFSDLHKKLQIASTYDINVEYQFWSFCSNLFGSYTDHSLTLLKSVHN